MFTVSNIEIDDNNRNKNFIFSPFSIHNLLSIIFNGAKGETNEKLKIILSDNCTKNIDCDIVNKDNYVVVNSLINEMKNSNIKLITDNFLFIRKDLSLNEQFINNIMKFYKINFMKFDLDKIQEFLNTINESIAVSTNNLIPNLLSKISPNTNLILVNTLYFKGLWDQKFDRNETKIENFFTGKKMIDVEMMHKKCKFNYYENEKFKACKLNFNGKKFSLTIFLPKEGVNINEVELSMTDSNVFNSLFNKNTERIVNLHLPKFKISLKNNLHEFLKAINLKNLASGDASDLSNMLVKGNLDAVKFEQKAVIEVNEEGTEAAAATSMIGTFMLLPEEHVEMNVNRSFCFSLDYQKDKCTSIPLFMGTINNPIN